MIRLNKLINNKYSYNNSRFLLRAFSSKEIEVTFLRHGQSTWNKENIFIGMHDTPLTEEGKCEATVAGRLLHEGGLEFDEIHTSLLSRSTGTVDIAVNVLDIQGIPIHNDWRLNERNYGSLVGRNKKACVDEYGAEKVKLWRRSWDVPPPPMDKESPFWPLNNPVLRDLGVTEEDIPPSESLKNVTSRTSVFWDEVIKPRLYDKRRLLIVGHENNLRSIIKRLDGISEKDIINLELPRAVPLMYRLDAVSLKPIKHENSAPGLSGQYLMSKDDLSLIAERDYKQVYGNN